MCIFNTKGHSWYSISFLSLVLRIGIRFSVFSYLGGYVNFEWCFNILTQHDRAKLDFIPKAYFQIFALSKPFQKHGIANKTVLIENFIKPIRCCYLSTFLRLPISYNELWKLLFFYMYTYLNKIEITFTCRS